MHPLFRGKWYAPRDFDFARMRHLFRRPRTTQERRRWFADVDRRHEHPQLKLRARRAACHLANAWDDNYLSRLADRTWKWRHGTQYAPVNR